MKETDLIQKYGEEKISDAKLRAGIERNRGFFQSALSTCFELSETKADGDAKDFKSNSDQLSHRINQVCDFFLPYYTKADLLAEQYQKFYKRGSTLIYLFAVIAVLTVTVQALFHVVPHWAILIEVISIICIIFIIEYGNRRGWHRRWIDYRFLAERLRCALFMALIGEKAYLTFPANDLYHLREEDNWILKFFGDVWSKWEKNKEQNTLIPVTFNLIKRFIQCGWLADQKRFHKKNIRIHERSHKQLSWAGLLLFYSTLLFAVIHFLRWGGEAAGPVWTLFAIAFPTIGLTFTAMRAHFEHNKLVRRSRKMVNRIEAIEDMLEEADTMDKLLTVCRQIEILMLSETTEWHGLISFHHLEPPG